MSTQATVGRARVADLGTVVELDYATCRKCPRGSADLALLVFLPDKATSWSRSDFSGRKYSTSTVLFQLEDPSLPTKGHQWKISKHKEDLYKAEHAKV